MQARGQDSILSALPHKYQVDQKRYHSRETHTMVIRSLPHTHTNYMNYIVNSEGAQWTGIVRTTQRDSIVEL